MAEIKTPPANPKKGNVTGVSSFLAIVGDWQKEQEKRSASGGGGFLGQLWYRGVNQQFSSLIPGVYRPLIHRARQAPVQLWEHGSQATASLIVMARFGVFCTACDSRVSFERPVLADHGKALSSAYCLKRSRLYDSTRPRLCENAGHPIRACQFRPCRCDFAPIFGPERHAVAPTRCSPPTCQYEVRHLPPTN